MERGRFLLKVSGECFGLVDKNSHGGYNRAESYFIASEIVSIGDRFEKAILVGGGNIIRGTILKEPLGLTAAVMRAKAGNLRRVLVDGDIGPEIS